MESLQARFCIIDCRETLRVSRNDESRAVIARALPEAIYNLAKSKFTMESFWRDSTLWICARADKFANANVCHEILATLAMTQRFAYCCVGCGR